jgi:hypothetical protein
MVSTVAYNPASPRRRHSPGCGRWRRQPRDDHSPASQGVDAHEGDDLAFDVGRKVVTGHAQEVWHTFNLRNYSASSVYPQITQICAEDNLWQSAKSADFLDCCKEGSWSGEGGRG